MPVYHFAQNSSFERFLIPLYSCGLVWPALHPGALEKGFLCFFFTGCLKIGNICSMKYGTKAIKQARLELWPNPNPEKDYVIEISYPEFTCLCPRSGYPDFATINITYTPDRKVVELKALKLWLNSFRDQSISHEAVTNLIFDTLAKQLAPRRLDVVGDFNVRGNVKTVIRVSL
jgi:7-cyano-7-deazaguanine reductase